MVPVVKQIAIAMFCMLTVLSALPAGASAAAAPDPVENGWLTRAGIATKRLASPGLDKCDSGVELAFQQFNPVTAGTQRSFELMIEIDKQSMVASYTYEGPRLISFTLLSLPPEWLAVQKPDSKGISILVQGSGCSFDLCTNDPFATGACAK